MQKRIIIIHGWAVNSQKNWFPWIKKELESRGLEVVVPDMPNSKDPQLKEWLGVIENLHPNKDAVLVGHSLGVTAILRYLDQTREPIHGSVLVASSVRLIKKVRRESIQHFFDAPFDYEHIKSVCPKFTAIYSKDDPSIPFEVHSEAAKKLLNAKLVVIESGGHLTGDVPFDVALILNEILEIARE